MKFDEMQPIELSKEELDGLIAFGGWIYHSLTHRARKKVGFPPQGSKDFVDYQRKVQVERSRLFYNLVQDTSLASTSLEYLAKITTLVFSQCGDFFPEAAGAFLGAVMTKNMQVRDVRGCVQTWMTMPARKIKNDQ